MATKKKTTSKGIQPRGWPKGFVLDMHTRDVSQKKRGTEWFWDNPPTQSLAEVLTNFDTMKKLKEQRTRR